MVMEWNDLTIYIDPYGGPDLYQNFPEADLVLITHPHGDHLDKNTLKGLDLENAELIAPQSVINDLGLDRARVNPLGGAIALGHPLGATGAIRTATLVHGMQRRGHRYGMVTMCIGTGMGAAGVFERVS